MSIRIRWTNLSNAIVDLPRPLWSTSVGFMGRVTEYVRQGFNKPYERIKSCLTSQSSQPCECGSATDCLGCAPFSCARLDPNSNHYVGDRDINYTTRDKDGNEAIINIRATKCACGNTEYTVSTASIRAEGQGGGARIRIGNELRNNKCSSKDARTTISNNDGL